MKARHYRRKVRRAAIVPAAEPTLDNRVRLAEAIGSVGIRRRSRELLDRLCATDTRGPTDQLDVIIREAAERRGIVPEEPKCPTSCTT